MKKTLIGFSMLLAILISMGICERSDFKTAERFAPEKLRELVGTRNVTPEWVKGSDIFIYRFKKDSITEYYYIDPHRGIKKVLFNRNILASKLSALLGGEADPKNLELSDINLDQSGNKFFFLYKKNKYEYNFKSKKLKQIEYDQEIEDKESIYKRSPDGKWKIYAKGHNLFLKKVSGNDSIGQQLTFDGEKWFSYSVKEEEEQNRTEERTTGEWFSDSKKIYCVRKDKRKVKDLFLVHSTSVPRPTLESYKYAMAGDKDLPHFHISIIDIESGKITDVETEKWEDQQIGSEGKPGIYPGDDSSALYFVRTSRDWKDVELCEADTASGNVKVLLRERSEPYWNADFQQFHLLDKTGKFLWWSEKSGRGHLYLYDRDGKEISQVTSGEYTVSDVLKIDRSNKTIYFSSHGIGNSDDPYYRKYCRIGFNGEDLKILTPEKGTHTIHISPSLKYFVDTWSSVTNPDISVLKDIRGNIIIPLEELDISKLLSYGWAPPEEFTVKAADNKTDLYGVMWKPFKMEKGKKYPLISYVYPGPQGEPVPKTFFQIRDKRVSNIPLAQLGFIVISVGQRGGSPLRTREYHNYGYGNARDYPLADNKYAIEQLSEKYDFIDIERVGIYGRSGGGFMSAAAILVYPDFYKVAVSSCGNHDNNIYDYVWGEIHYGLEKKITTNIEVAENLKGRLLLIHGEVDNNVHPANTFRLAEELIKKGKRFDMMIFPAKRHVYNEYTPYLERMMWYYFAEHLLGDKRENIDIFRSE